MKNTSILFAVGGSNTLFWAVVVIATVFVVYLIVDWLAMHQRDRKRLERKRRAAAEHAAEMDCIKK